jgi:hypothetical protein
MFHMKQKDLTIVSSFVFVHMNISIFCTDVFSKMKLCFLVCEYVFEGVLCCVNSLVVLCGSLTMMCE